MVETDRPSVLFEERLRPNLEDRQQVKAILGLVWAARDDEVVSDGKLWSFSP